MVLNMHMDSWPPEITPSTAGNLSPVVRSHNYRIDAKEVQKEGNSGNWSSGEGCHRVRQAGRNFQRNERTDFRERKNVNEKMQRSFRIAALLNKKFGTGPDHGGSGPLCLSLPPEPTLKCFPCMRLWYAFSHSILTKNSVLNTLAM